MYIKIEKQANESCASTKFDLNTEQMKCALSTFALRSRRRFDWNLEGEQMNKRNNNNNEKTNIIQRPWQLRPLQFVATKIARLNSLCASKEKFSVQMTHEARRNLKRELIIFWTLFACRVTYYHIINSEQMLEKEEARGFETVYNLIWFWWGYAPRICSIALAVLDISVVIDVWLWFCLLFVCLFVFFSSLKFRSPTKLCVALTSTRNVSGKYCQNQAQMFTLESKFIIRFLWHVCIKTPRSRCLVSSSSSRVDESAIYARDDADDQSTSQPESWRCVLWNPFKYYAKDHFHLF